MKSYRIVSSAGVDMGIYDGETVADAVRAMHRDAGYTSDEHIEEALGKSVDELVAEVRAEEVAS